MTSLRPSSSPNMVRRKGEKRSMFSLKLLLIFSLSLFTGCAAYELRPLTTKHPANPKAMAAPFGPTSQTLAYRPSDIPSIQPAATSSVAEPSGGEGRQTVVGEGRVIAVVPSNGQLVIDHGEIKGFMEAMTMGYKVDSPSLLQGLKAGDKIRFTIDTQKKAIVKIRKMEK